MHHDYYEMETMKVMTMCLVMNYKKPSFWFLTDKYVSCLFVHIESVTISKIMCTKLPIMTSSCVT